MRQPAKAIRNYVLELCFRQSIWAAATTVALGSKTFGAFMLVLTLPFCDTKSDDKCLNHGMAAYIRVNELQCCWAAVVSIIMLLDGQTAPPGHLQ